MQVELILWPVLVQVFLTLGMFVLLGVRKAKAIREGGVDRQKAALDNHAWPAGVIKVSNNIQNQFQTPILFYVLCLAFLIINGVSLAVFLIACMYSVSRLIHAYIHVGSNYVPARLRAFMIGCIALIALSIMLVLQLAVN